MSAQQPIDPVRHFCPWASDSEATIRKRLLNARNFGSARALQSKNSRARELLWIISEVAGDWVFRRANADELSDLANGLCRIMLGVNALERVEGDDGV
jgi:hypothetical protein